MRLHHVAWHARGCMPVRLTWTSSRAVRAAWLATAALRCHLHRCISVLNEAHNCCLTACNLFLVCHHGSKPGVAHCHQTTRLGNCVSDGGGLSDMLDRPRARRTAACTQ
eukprot:749856-Hanusia_phi.AAC.2